MTRLNKNDLDIILEQLERINTVRHKIMEIKKKRRKNGTQNRR